MIRVFHTNGKFMIWDSNDVLALRTQHRIVGSLIGSLADHTQQNLFHGIPLLLEIEEVFVGIQNNFITLVDNVVFERPNKEDVDNYWNHQYKEAEEDFIKERERKKAKEKEWREKNLLFESNNKPKRKKVDKEKQTEEDVGDTNEKENNDKSEPTKIEESTLNTNDSSNTNNLDNTTTPSLTTSQTNTTQTTLIVDTNEPQQSETNPTTTTTTITSTPPLDLNLTIPSTSLRKMNFSIPNLTFTSQQILRCKIFSDLWSRGFYLTCASKFGGDFLAYPGDPLRFHAHYVIIVVKFDQSITMLDIISYGRLAVSVKKSPVLATVDNNDMVRYTTIDWQGVT